MRLKKLAFWTPARSSACALPLALMLVRVAAGCGADDSGNAPDASFDSATTGSASDGAGASVDAGAGAPALFRFAHLSAGLGPLDLCYRVGSTDAFTGPVFAPLSPAVDAGKNMQDASDSSVAASAGISFPSLTPYAIAPGTGIFEIAIVDATTASCSTPVARGNITIAPGQKWTIAIAGDFSADLDASNALTILSFMDDDETAPDASRSRFIHAAVGGHGGNAYGPFSVGAQTGSLVPLAGEVDPENASLSSSAAPVVDALGYHNDIAIDEGSLQLAQMTDAAVQPAAWISAPTSLALPAGSLRTGFIVSDAKGLAVLWCDDLSDASDCEVLRQ